MLYNSGKVKGERQTVEVIIGKRNIQDHKGFAAMRDLHQSQLFIVRHIYSMHEFTTHMSKPKC